MADLTRAAPGGSRRTGLVGSNAVSAETFSAASPLVVPRPRPPWRRLLHPLTAILAVQAGLSLTLVWTNTAFTDEADDLWIGHLLINHWLHGTSWPSAYGDKVLSGSPIIYPPLGALADSIGGLAGARMLSLAFMLGATALLYLTASRVVNRSAALIAAALWALSEPVLRLAFATYDPLSVLLTALAVWFAVEAAYRRRGELVAAAAVALALANATAYSGIIIDPVVIAFAFLVWLPRMGRRQAVFCAAWLAGGLGLCFGLAMTASHSWAGIMSTVTDRSGRQSILPVLDDFWGYAGLIIVLAVIGMVAEIGAGGRRRGALMTLLGGAALLVPLAQLLDPPAWLIDKHLAYGLWFAVIAAGYGGDKIIHWIPGARMRLAGACCVVALAYPAVNSWEAAWGVYHGWANSRSFITNFAPIAARSHGSIDAAAAIHIAEYYTPQGRQWARWTGALSLDPAGPRSTWSAYYESRLGSGSYGVIALFYTTTFSLVPLPGGDLLKPDASTQDLLALAADNSKEPGLAALTRALEADPRYQLAAQGPYDSANDYAIYAIWRKQAQA
jgi:hypothetical protein